MKTTPASTQVFRPYEKDHFKFGGPRDFIFTNGQDYSAQFGLPARPLSPFRDECQAAAEKILLTTTDPITVLYSGGIDSEVVAKSFLLAGRKPVLLFCRIEHHGKIVNEYDHRHVLDFSERSNSKLIELVTSYENIQNNIVPKMCQEVRLASPHVAFYLWLASQVSGPVVGAYSDLFAYRESGARYPTHREHPYHARIVQFIEQHRLRFVPRFFFYTPEVIAARLIDPIFARYIRLARPMRMMGFKRFKPIFFDHHFPELLPRHKVHGFESMQKEEDLNFKHYGRLWESQNRPACVDHQTFLSAMGLNLNRYEHATVNT